ncbi:helix-turn-helix domain-containing protein [Chloroflexota bacterium]
MAIDDESKAGSCIVCSHAEAETINSLLRQGKSLRDIESEFDVSRSTLSRYKNRCLNLA